MSKNSISILIGLANIDGVVDEKERKLIHKIGAAHSISDEEIEALFKTPKQIDYDVLTSDDRFDMLYNLVLLMKVDGKIFDEEIMYCLEAAKRLHFPLEAVMDLYGLVHANLKLTSEINTLKRKYQKG